MINNQIKTQLWQQGCKLLEQKVADLRQDIRDINEAMESESKSSAGDKHETGRAMMHLDLERTSKQLADAKESLDSIRRINADKSHTSVSTGTLIETTAGIYFISVPLGKVSVVGVEAYMISIMSPLGQLLKGKGSGESITLNGRNISILGIC